MIKYLDNMQLPPILITTYNRPDTTQKVLDVVSQLKPSTIYISGDGPKDEEDKKKVGIVRAMTVTQIDWKCKLKVDFAKKNLGLRRRMASAIDWFFEDNKEGIILEDDCVPDTSFFPYCEELLKKYQKNKKIMHITGDNFLEAKKGISKSYYFSKHPHCWGWASWRRAWSKYDDKMVKWPKLRNTGWLKNIVNDRIAEIYWKKVFDLTYADKIDSWAYRWQYSIWLNEGVCINPNKNLVQNIGQGLNATNTKMDKVESAGKMKFPLKHPKVIQIDERADKITEKNRFVNARTVSGLIYKSLFS
jgi:hypothetical protein